MATLALRNGQDKVNAEDFARLYFRRSLETILPEEAEEAFGGLIRAEPGKESYHEQTMASRLVRPLGNRSEHVPFIAWLTDQLEPTEPQSPRNSKLRLLVGGAATGKSTLLQAFTLRIEQARVDTLEIQQARAQARAGALDQTNQQRLPARHIFAMKTEDMERRYVKLESNIVNSDPACVYVQLASKATADMCIEMLTNGTFVPLFQHDPGMLILDGLDEMDNDDARRDVLNAVSQHLNNNECTTKILLSTRLMERQEPTSSATWKQLHELLRINGTELKEWTAELLPLDARSARAFHNAIGGKALGEAYRIIGERLDHPESTLRTPAEVLMKIRMLNKGKDSFLAHSIRMLGFHLARNGLIEGRSNQIVQIHGKIWKDFIDVEKWRIEKFEESENRFYMVFHHDEANEEQQQTLREFARMALIDVEKDPIVGTTSYFLPCDHGFGFHLLTTMLSTLKDELLIFISKVLQKLPALDEPQKRAKELDRLTNGLLEATRSHGFESVLERWDRVNELPKISTEVSNAFDGFCWSLLRAPLGFFLEEDTSENAGEDGQDVPTEEDPLLQHLLTDGHLPPRAATALYTRLRDTSIPPQKTLQDTPLGHWNNDRDVWIAWVNMLVEALHPLHYDEDIAERHNQEVNQHDEPSGAEVHRMTEVEVDGHSENDVDESIEVDLDGSQDMEQHTRSNWLHNLFESITKFELENAFPEGNQEKGKEEETERQKLLLKAYWDDCGSVWQKRLMLRLFAIPREQQLDRTYHEILFRFLYMDTFGLRKIRFNTDVFVTDSLEFLAVKEGFDLRNRSKRNLRRILDCTYELLLFKNQVTSGELPFTVRMLLDVVVSTQIKRGHHLNLFDSKFDELLGKENSFLPFRTMSGLLAAAETKATDSRAVAFTTLLVNEFLPGNFSYSPCWVEKRISQTKTIRINPSTNKQIQGSISNSFQIDQLSQLVNKLHEGWNSGWFRDSDLICLLLYGARIGHLNGVRLAGIKISQDSLKPTPSVDYSWFFSKHETVENAFEEICNRDHQVFSTVAGFDRTSTPIPPSLAAHEPSGSMLREQGDASKVGLASSQIHENNFGNSSHLQPPPWMFKSPSPFEVMTDGSLGTISSHEQGSTVGLKEILDYIEQADEAWVAERYAFYLFFFESDDAPEHGLTSDRRETIEKKVIESILYWHRTAGPLCSTFLATRCGMNGLTSMLQHMTGDNEGWSSLRSTALYRLLSRRGISPAHAAHSFPTLPKELTEARSFTEITETSGTPWDNLKFVELFIPPVETKGGVLQNTTKYFVEFLRDHQLSGDVHIILRDRKIVNSHRLILDECAYCWTSAGSNSCSCEVVSPPAIVIGGKSDRFGNRKMIEPQWPPWKYLKKKLRVTEHPVELKGYPVFDRKAVHAHDRFNGLSPIEQDALWPKDGLNFPLLMDLFKENLHEVTIGELEQDERGHLKIPQFDIEKVKRHPEYRYRTDRKSKLYMRRIPDFEGLMELFAGVLDEVTYASEKIDVKLLRSHPKFIDLEDSIQQTILKNLSRANPALIEALGSEIDAVFRPLIDPETLANHPELNSLSADPYSSEVIDRFTEEIRGPRSVNLQKVMALPEFAKLSTSEQHELIPPIGEGQPNFMRIEAHFQSLDIYDHEPINVLKLARSAAFIKLTKEEQHELLPQHILGQVNFKELATRYPDLHFEKRKFYATEENIARIDAAAANSEENLPYSLLVKDFQLESFITKMYKFADQRDTPERYRGFVLAFAQYNGILDQRWAEKIFQIPADDYRATESTWDLNAWLSRYSKTLESFHQVPLRNSVRMHPAERFLEIDVPQSGIKYWGLPDNATNEHIGEDQLLANVYLTGYIDGKNAIPGFEKIVFKDEKVPFQKTRSEKVFATLDFRSHPPGLRGLPKPFGIRRKTSKPVPGDTRSIIWGTPLKNAFFSHRHPHFKRQKKISRGHRLELFALDEVDIHRRGRNGNFTYGWKWEVSTLVEDEEDFDNWNHRLYAGKADHVWVETQTEVYTSNTERDVISAMIPVLRDNEDSSPFALQADDEESIRKQIAFIEDRGGPFQNGQTPHRRYWAYITQTWNPESSDVHWLEHRLMQHLPEMIKQAEDGIATAARTEFTLLLCVLRDVFWTEKYWSSNRKSSFAHIKECMMDFLDRVKKTEMQRFGEVQDLTRHDIQVATSMIEELQRQSDLDITGEVQGRFSQLFEKYALGEKRLTDIENELDLWLVDTDAANSVDLMEEWASVKDDVSERNEEARSRFDSVIKALYQKHKHTIDVRILGATSDPSKQSLHVYGKELMGDLLTMAENNEVREGMIVRLDLIDLRTKKRRSDDHGFRLANVLLADEERRLFAEAAPTPGPGSTTETDNTERFTGFLKTGGKYVVKLNGDCISDIPMGHWDGGRYSDMHLLYKCPPGKHRFKLEKRISRQHGRLQDYASLDREANETGGGGGHGTVH